MGGSRRQHLVYSLLATCRMTPPSRRMARAAAHAPEDQMPSVEMRERKLHPKLRMIANGDDGVNARRAELSSIVAYKEPSGSQVRGAGVVALSLGETAVRKPRAPLAQPATRALTNIFVDLHRDARRSTTATGSGASVLDTLQEIAKNNGDPPPLQKGGIVT